MTPSATPKCSAPPGCPSAWPPKSPLKNRAPYLLRQRQWIAKTEELLKDGAKKIGKTSTRKCSW